MKFEKIPILNQMKTVMGPEIMYLMQTVWAYEKMVDVNWFEIKCCEIQEQWTAVCDGASAHLIYNRFFKQ